MNRNVNVHSAAGITRTPAAIPEYGQTTETKQTEKGLLPIKTNNMPRPCALKPKECWLLASGTTGKH